MGWLRRTLSCLRRPTHAHASHGAAMTEVLFLPAGENRQFISEPPCILDRPTNFLDSSTLSSSTKPPVAGWHCRQGTKPCIPVTLLLTMLVTRDFEATVTGVKAGDARL